MPRFAVVIPAYNAASTIAETLDSLDAQTYRDFEVVVVDDHSTDDTRSICEARSIQVTLRDHGLPRGPAACRNVGVGSTTSAWIVFLDADDLAMPTRLDRISACIDHFGDGVAMVSHPAAFFGPGKYTRASVGSGNPNDRNWRLDSLCDGNDIACSAVAVRRDAFEREQGFDVSLRGVEDWHLWLRLSRWYAWGFIDEPLTNYRVNQTSLMSGRPLAEVRDQYLRLLTACQTWMDGRQFSHLERAVNSSMRAHASQYPWITRQIARLTGRLTIRQ